MFSYLKFIFYFFFIFIISIEKVKADVYLNEAVKNEYRAKKNFERDKYRNPYETLSFFGIKREMMVLEMIPGRGWYTEIISSYMKNTNNYYVAKYDPPKFAVEIITKIQKEFDEYFLKNKNVFGNVQSVSINEDFEILSGKKKFDLIMTFRNTHNWLDSNNAEKIYRSIFNSMKKGGVLGVVQHRADESSEFNYKGGYVKESFLIRLIENQGFKLIEKSEINSNLKDLKNYTKGVWTLPPTLRLGDKNKSKYLNIGESDRMTLKFIKP